MKIAYKNGRIYFRPDNTPEHNQISMRLQLSQNWEWSEKFHCFSIPDTIRNRREHSLPPSDGGSEWPILLRHKKTEQWKHQEEAYKFAYELMAHDQSGAMLAMDMGTGKSKVAVDLIFNLPQIKKVLICCPKAVCSVWYKQFINHAPLDYELLVLSSGATPARAQALAALFKHASIDECPHIAVINYDVIFRDVITSVLRRSLPDMIICDESHRLQDPGGRTSRVLASLGRKTTYRLCLTGTPMSNGPVALYGQFRFLQPDVFGTSFNDFRNNFVIMGGYENRQIVGYKNKETLADKFRSISFVVSSEVLDLPPEMNEVIEVELSAKARKIYDDLDNEFVAELENGVISAANALTRLIRLQQLTSGYAKVDETEEYLQVCTAKQEALENLLDSTNEAFVVFCRFVSDLAAVQTICKKLKRPYYEVSGRLKQNEEWKEGVIGVQIQAGGLGIDLTLARYAAYYSLGYSLTDYLQSLKRVRRPGQTRPVTYYHLVAKNTVDKEVYRALERKEDVVQSILTAHTSRAH